MQLDGRGRHTTVVPALSPTPTAALWLTSLIQLLPYEHLVVHNDADNSNLIPCAWGNEPDI